VGANWSPTGGVDGANDGYLIITEAQGSQKTVIVFDDFDNGLVVKGFEFSCYLKVGDGSFRRLMALVLIMPELTTRWC